MIEDGTEVYGASDDLVEFEGVVRGEVAVGNGESVLVAFDDGTVLVWRYGKGSLGIWQCTVLNQGTAFKWMTSCIDENAEIHSDVVVLDADATRAWYGRESERVY